MVKLKYTGPGKQRVPGVGDFIKGTVHEAPEAIANQFRGLKGWTVLEERKETTTPPAPAPEAQAGRVAGSRKGGTRK